MGKVQTNVVVPVELRAKYPELIELILRSESMNDEERQYWINILPVMTQDQIANLRKILENERDQLAAIDAKYSQEMAHLGTGMTPEEVGQHRRAKREERLQKEQQELVEEQSRTEEILRRIEES
jgi:Icc-related predicted phosphoesterase